MSETTVVSERQKGLRPGIQQKLITRRSFLRGTALSAAGLALYSGEFERHEIEVVPRTIVLSGLPDAFAGFRIVQLSDIHFGEYSEGFFLKSVVHKVNALNPDLVVLTGDNVSLQPLARSFAIRMSYQCAELLSQLLCPLRYAILGNHDVAVSAPAVTDSLTSHGIPVLINRSVPIERNGSRIWLAGLADILEQRADLSLALTRAGNSEPVILLVHEPDFADHILNRGVSLVLAGHTHGGQVRMPFVGPVLLPPLGTKYVEGHFLLDGQMQLYVNRGIGTVGLPFRFLCPPEITVITLQPGLPSAAV